jgi:hypothetical protein
MNTFLDHRVLDRIRAEYLEMPGMKLTLEQVQRLCGIEQSMCKAVLDSLVEALFLCLRPDGTYVRLTEGRVPRRQVKETVLQLAPLVRTARRAS